MKETIKASVPLTETLMKKFGRRGLARLVEPVAGKMTDEGTRKWKLYGIPLAYVYYIRAMYPEAYKDALGDLLNETDNR